MPTNITEGLKQKLIDDLNERVKDKIIEPTNADLLIKLINKCDTEDEAVSVAELGTTYKRTGFHFDKRLDRVQTSDTIRYLKKNDVLSFSDGSDKPHNKLIIGDNYDALQNLLIEYKNDVDVIYIDPPYAMDEKGDFAKTNYENSITRDNLLSMLYPRLILARELLSDEGILFCSIDDKNQSYVKGLLDEVFGERYFLFCAPRITKKGGKSTDTIQKNHDYILCYTLSTDIIFSQEEKDISSFNMSDEYVEDRGKYKLTQTLDYNSLQYSENMDFPITINGSTFIPGSDFELYEERHRGNHGQTDWVWRWSKQAVKWGIDNGFIVVKGSRIYTKTYLKCRKKNGANEIEYLEGLKPYTTRSFLDNKYSNDNGKKSLDQFFHNSNTIFKNPKPVELLKTLIKMGCNNKNAVVLDFYAGSGTTGQAVMELNNEDGGNRKFILCTNNEITDVNPNGIAIDVTTKRLKRVMTGRCYDGSSDFQWIKDHQPLGGSLDVFDIGEVANFERTEDKTAFDVIDETAYDEKFDNIQDKINWVCENFDRTQKILGGED